ncbi:hypothetical protein Ddc_17734 [Ditylenchus destructor]|nr:hypothetical protein Ddc_17734 [Ditylenchus destructor]
MKTIDIGIRLITVRDVTYGTLIMDHSDREQGVLKEKLVKMKGHENDFLYEIKLCKFKGEQTQNANDSLLKKLAEVQGDNRSQIILSTDIPLRLFNWTNGANPAAIRNRGSTASNKTDDVKSSSDDLIAKMME